MIERLRKASIRSLVIGLAVLVAALLAVGSAIVVVVVSASPPAEQVSLVPQHTAAPIRPDSWAVQVQTASMKKGLCLSNSVEYMGVFHLPPPPDTPRTFAADADFYESVSCAAPHTTVVLERVERPTDTDWDHFGTTSGKTLAEAEELLATTCSGLRQQLEGMRSQTGLDSVSVLPSKVLYDVETLGFCFLHDDDGLPTDVDFVALLDH